MTIYDFLLPSSRLTFFLLTFLSIRMGDAVGLVLSIAVFLIMENFIEDLINSVDNK